MSGTKILIVEDEPFLREAFRLMLEDSNYDVLEAGTGRDGISLARDQKPDLLLLDLGLPDMHGLDVARTLKGDASTSDIVCVALTGSVGQREKQECLDAGCSAYFPKPFSPKEFLKRIPALLGKEA